MALIYIYLGNFGSLIRHLGLVSPQDRTVKLVAVDPCVNIKSLGLDCERGGSYKVPVSPASPALAMQDSDVHEIMALATWQRTCIKRGFIMYASCTRVPKTVVSYRV